jgi:2-polyprenyl-3-methyl-5-hydroxy-6-metoxy-1,4-benzoquinol methylase
MNREAIDLKYNRDGEKLRLSERLLLAICRPTKAPPLPVTTYSYTPDNALDFSRRMVPDFPERLRGKTVLDYGCGPGWQAIAMRRAGAAHVHAMDVNEDWLAHGRALTQSAGVTGVSFGREPDADKYDAVISLCSMEHFPDPQKELLRMASMTRQELIITFSECWFSPHGTHLNGTTHLPWLNLMFSERTLINVRNLYPDGSDGAKCFAEVRGGLNKMTVARFERLISSVPGFRVHYFSLRGVKGLPIVTRIPVVRELLTSALTCILCPV